jgi:hypothetical protein
MEDVCRLVRGRIRLARGDLAGALEDAAADVELGRQQGAPEALQAALALQAHALLIAGSVEEADARAGELLALLAAQGVLVTNPDWSGELALVLYDLGWTPGTARYRRGWRPRPRPPGATSRRPPTSTPGSAPSPTRPPPASAPPAGCWRPAAPPTPTPSAGRPWPSTAGSAPPPSCARPRPRGSTRPPDRTIHRRYSSSRRSM